MLRIIEGKTLLMLAIENSEKIDNAPEVVSKLLEKGADPTIERGNEEFPTDKINALHTAAVFANFEIFKMIVEHEKSKDIINNQDAVGNTALYHVIDSYQEDMDKKDLHEKVKLLIELDADPTIKNNNGVTALDLAKNKNLTEVVNMLVDAMKK